MHNYREEQAVLFRHLFLKIASFVVIYFVKSLKNVAGFGRRMLRSSLAKVLQHQMVLQWCAGAGGTEYPRLWHQQVLLFFWTWQGFWKLENCNIENNENPRWCMKWKFKVVHAMKIQGGTCTHAMKIQGGTCIHAMKIQGGTTCIHAMKIQGGTCNENPRWYICTSSKYNK